MMQKDYPRSVSLLRLFAVLALLFGCARVRIDSKDPIKLDVTMRVDIYQHVAEDASAIEDMISAPASKAKAVSSQSRNFLAFETDVAYAQEVGVDLPVDVRAAVDRRRARKEELSAWEAKAVVGENSRGFAELRQAPPADGRVERLVEEENNDRRIIYRYIAAKDGAAFEETAKIFALKIQQNAPAGTPLELPGEKKWVTK